MSMYEEVQGLINNANVTKTDIVKNCEVSMKWLYRYLNDDFDDVGVRRLERIRDYLEKAEA